MIFDILTLSPGIFDSFLEHGIVSRAISKNIVKLRVHNIRDYATDKHHQVDDYAFGGGPGMVMKPEPLYDAITDLLDKENPCPVVYFTPQGRLMKQDIINRYTEKKRIIMVCGQYKEIDHRIRELLITDEISIGDYVLSGGEIPAMTFIDSVTRLLDGAIGDINSALTDSHQNNLLGCPHYTRPLTFNGIKVPDVLTSGNHKEIDKWRYNKAVNITREQRPDLFYENREK